MSDSLQEISKTLDTVIRNLYDVTEKELAENEKRLDAINKELAEMDKGDASENAPLQIKRDEQSMCAADSVRLAKRLASVSSELSGYTPNGFIQRGTTVEVKMITCPKGIVLPNNGIFIFKLVQHDTADATKQLVAVDSKLGAAIIGRTVGDTVQITAPSGVCQYKIERMY